MVIGINFFIEDKNGNRRYYSHSNYSDDWLDIITGFSVKRIRRQQEARYSYLAQQVLRTRLSLGFWRRKKIENNIILKYENCILLLASTSQCCIKTAVLI